VANLKKQACPEQRRMEPKPAVGRKSEILNPKSETDRMEAKRQIPAHFKECDLKKQSQSIIVQCSAFSGQRQDEKKEFEKTKPIAGPWPETRSTNALCEYYFTDQLQKSW